MWEYKTETFDSTFATKKSIKEKSDKVLETYGREGWELVNFQCVGAGGTMMIFIFKRKMA